jgi:glyoxylase-like metal-dependent hydrolase (beta-lactamase superfamily II)
MSFYCASEKICFTGDAMNVDTHLGGRDRQFFLDYADMLQKFIGRVDPDTTLFSAHLNRPNKMRVPRNILGSILEIAEGQVYGDQPAEAIQKHIGNYHNPHRKMHYHGLCVVCYDNSFLSNNEQ